MAVVVAIIEPVPKGITVRYPHRVGPGKNDHFFSRQVFRCKIVDELGGVEGRCREIGTGFSGIGNGTIASA